MLTRAPAGRPTGAGPARTVHLDVRDTTLRLALSYAMEGAGWALVSGPTSETARVADRLHGRADRPPLDVLVIPPSPAASRSAVEAFTAGAARSVLRSSEPGALPALLDLVRRGLGVVPAAVVDAAHGFPLLPPRLERTLDLVLRGWSNRSIARDVHQSETTTKRDVGELLRHFDAPNRVALAATAIRLGVHPDRPGRA